MVAVARPAGVGDLVFPTTAAEHWCEAFADAKIHWLLLYGPPGTGKSAAAEALMRSRIPDINWSFDAAVFNAAATRDVATLTSTMGALKLAGNNSQSQRVMIIDEVDCLSSDSSKILKGLLDKLPEKTPVIMTTNHQDKLEGALLSRFQEVHWSGLSPDELAKWGEGRCTAMGRKLTGQERNLLRMYASDYRKMLRLMATF